MVNHLSKEEMLTKMAELLDVAVNWGLKTLLGTVVGSADRAEYGKPGNGCHETFCCGKGGEVRFRVLEMQ